MDAPYFGRTEPKSNRNTVLVPFSEERETHRWCNQCRRWKPLNDFYSDVAHLAGRYICRLCDNRNRVRRRADKDLENLLN